MPSARATIEPDRGLRQARARARRAARASPARRSGSRSSARKFRLPAPQPGRRSSSSGRASVMIEDRDVAAPLQHVVDEVEQARVRPVEVLEQQHDGARRRRAARRTSATRRTAPRAAGRRLVRRPSSASSAGSTQRRSVLVGHVLRDASRRASSRVVASSSVSSRPRARADHLAQRPERDALAVGGRAALVPPDGLDHAVDVLQELPGQAALADARLTRDRHEPGPALARRRVEQVLEQAQLVVAADERRLEPLVATPAAALRDDPQRAPGGDRRGLALEQLLAGRLERDRARRGALGRLADEHGARRRRPTGGGRRC